jgi:hypothetical protein
MLFCKTDMVGVPGGVNGGKNGAGLAMVCGTPSVERQPSRSRQENLRMITFALRYDSLNTPDPSDMDRKLS